MRILSLFDMMLRLKVMEALQSIAIETSQLSHMVVASLLRLQTPSVCAQCKCACLYSTIAKYNGPLEALHAHFDSV